MSAEDVCKIPVTHFFTHALIAHTDIAFNTKNEMRNNYDKDCLTPHEFKMILQSLYDKNFVLIDINEVYTTINGIAVKKVFNFPKGKKPLILSFDDINYYTSKMNLGMVDKLIVDSNGNICTYTEKAKTKISYDNCVVSALEQFILKYPDFSHNNARGVLCLTGFDGILGYRTQYSSLNRQEEIAKVKPIISKLKENGWKFACHSYGHYHMKKINTEKFNSDTRKWINEVEPLVGKTDIYVYPYGEWELQRNDDISPKHKYLKSQGFSFFWGVGNNTFFEYMPSKKEKSNRSLFMDRMPIDGLSLRAFRDRYLPYFDSKAVYDSARFKGYI